MSIEKVNALKKFNFDDVALAAIEKIVRNNIEGAVFHALALLDAVEIQKLLKLIRPG